MQKIVLSLENARKMLPVRDPFGHKGSFGKVLLLCGSLGYTGAAWFSAMGALRSGTGLVFLGVPQSIYAIEAVKLNEPVLFPLPDQEGIFSREAAETIRSRLPSADAVLVGCGIGRSEGAEAMVGAVLSEAECPVVLDADGISAAAAHKDILRRRTAPTILTPHDGEFLRIGGILQEDRLAAAAALSGELNAIVLLKGHRTCITDGKIGYINETGNSGMAKGGSGDILAGLITGLLGQGMAPLEAAACGACFHGAAGDLAARNLSQYSMLPTDLLTVLPQIIRREGM